jgi:hypothetical protein
MSAAMQPADAPLVGATWFMPPDSCPRFSVETSPELRGRGVRGERSVIVLTPGEIRLMGSGGGDAFIPLARVDGLRVGVTRGRRERQPVLRLRLLEPAETLLFLPLGEPADVTATDRGYAGFVRSLAKELAARGRADGVETGTGLGWATAVAVAFGSVTAAMIGLFAWTLVTPQTGLDALWAPLVTGAAALGMLAGDVRWWQANWPLRVRPLADLERMLTP